MVNILSCLREDKLKNIRFFLNYPAIEVDNVDTNNFANQINSLIYNDIKIFEEVVTSSFENEQIIGGINAIAEYRESFNKNNIISIPVEFSQIVGLTDISHVCSYNYDLSLMKRITLDQIFRKGVNFERIIESYIMEEIYSVIEKYETYMHEDLYDLIEESLYICENPVFYFDNEKLIISVGSFELTTKVCNLVEFPIYFKNIKRLLSDYTLKYIVN